MKGQRHRPSITLHGVRHHNLKDIDVKIPRGRLVAITGVSGSGKSSLAFDTLYAEGRRCFLATLSTYARRFIRQFEKPDLDSAMGIPPALALEQKKVMAQPRSTVGTLTEIYDALRLWFTRAGTCYCPHCRIPVKGQTIDAMIADVQAAFEGRIVAVMALVVKGRKGKYSRELKAAVQRGLTWGRIDGRFVRLEAVSELDPRRHHDIDFVIDRIRVTPARRARLHEALRSALSEGKGFACVVPWPTNSSAAAGDPPPELLLSRDLRCPRCGFQFPAIEPWFFSFSSPQGACPLCRGIGRVTAVDMAREKRQRRLQAQARLRVKLVDWLAAADNDMQADRLTCPACHGTRLRPEARAVMLGGLSIADVAALELDAFAAWCRDAAADTPQAAITRLILDEIERRLTRLLRLGLGYLSLARRVDTLSTGELQRVRLAAQLGQPLRGALYVLDEPTVGLHARDTLNLIEVLQELRAGGNTVVVVEHDDALIRAADLVIDIGPGAGENGGRIVAAAPPAALTNNPDSLTAAYLSGRRTLPPRPRLPTPPSDEWLVLVQPRRHNLAMSEVRFPLGRLTVVTGVSGSGKSTLVFDVLAVDLAAVVNRAAAGPLKYCQAVQGADRIFGVRCVNQDPIGRTPRSCPVTYLNIFTPIRDLFAAQPAARMWGFDRGRFSFNTPAGRCPQCKGLGAVRYTMKFLADTYVTCEACQGRRYNRETLRVKWHGLSIADVLHMTVAEAAERFAFQRHVATVLDLMNDLALGYLRLGQPTYTLSGGESQRLKLVRELARANRRPLLYLLDEPTTGLHPEDIRHLLVVFDRLVAAGHTLVVIEHNLDVITRADWLVDLGPGGGRSGGRVVAAGPPEEVRACPQSITGQVLDHYYARRSPSLPLSQAVPKRPSGRR